MVLVRAIAGTVPVYCVPVGTVITVVVDLGRLDMGLATVGGLGIVLLAITLDRLTQAMGKPRRGVRHWYQTGPAGFILRLVRGGSARGEAAAPARSLSAQ